MRKIIWIQTALKKITGKTSGHIKQWNDSFFGVCFETAPITNMLFRPEEIHSASGMGQVIKPLAKRDTGVGNKTFWVSFFNHTIFHFHFDRRSTVKTGSINPDNLPREKPADRQRLKSSLTEPFLLAINC